MLSTRTAELGVAVFFIILFGITAWGSWEIGAGWTSSGPGAGSFPFYTSMFVIVCSALVFLFGARNKEAAASTYVTTHQFKQVLKVLIPSAVYAAVIGFIGIYVSSIIFIAAFMMWLGKYHFVKAVVVSVCVSVAFFLLFEIWFHVPLPKGPIEAVLGLN
jgi:hypothetical protein